jgi:transposase
MADRVVGDNIARASLEALVRELLRENAELKRREEELIRRHEELAQRNEELTRRVAALERELAAAKKDSSNSSKPPSGDLGKPTSGDITDGRASRPRRKRGGQPGHPKHERSSFPSDKVDHVETHTLSACPDCGGTLKKLKSKTRVTQQAELVAAPIRVEEHRCETYACCRCGRTQVAPLPASIEAGGLLGPRLTAIVGYMKGACHASYTTIAKYFKDVLGLTLSRGFLAKIIRKMTRAIGPACDALRRRLPSEARINSDETGHRENGRRAWTWCFRAEDFALFKISDSRGSNVIGEHLGAAYQGILCCDYFSAYRKYMKVAGARVQFCLAHLIRDLKYLETLPDEPTVVYAGCLRTVMQRVFGTIHRREQLTPKGYLRSLRGQRSKFIALATRDVPDTPEARNMARRFEQHGDAYFEFIDSPVATPTNNLAEQSIRHVVIDRRITQGTRGDVGRAWCERIWTVLATCAQQGRSAFAFLQDAIDAQFTQRPAPMLIEIPN